MEKKIIAVIDAPTGRFIAQLAAILGASCEVHANLPDNFQSVGTQAMLSILHDVSYNEKTAIAEAAQRGAQVLILRQNLMTRTRFNDMCDELALEHPSIQFMSKSEFITQNPLELLRTYLSSQRT